MSKERQALLDTLHGAQKLYGEASEEMGKARVLRARAIAELLKPGGMTVRELASELDMSPNAVQQIYDTLWTHRVGFIGTLSDEAAKALDEAGIALRFSRGSGSVGEGEALPAATKHGVYLVADSDAEAETIVKRALKGHGDFVAFEVKRTPGYRDPE